MSTTSTLQAASTVPPIVLLADDDFPRLQQHSRYMPPTFMGSRSGATSFTS